MKSLTYIGGLVFSAALCTGAFADVVATESTTTAPAPVVTERATTAPIVTEKTTTAPAVESSTTTVTTEEERARLSHRERERLEKDYKHELKDR